MQADYPLAAFDLHSNRKTQDTTLKFKYSNALSQFKSTHIQIFKYSNIQIFKHLAGEADADGLPADVLRLPLRRGDAGGGNHAGYGSGGRGAGTG